VREREHEDAGAAEPDLRLTAREVLQQRAPRSPPEEAPLMSHCDTAARRHHGLVAFRRGKRRRTLASDLRRGAQRRLVDTLSCRGSPRRGAK
jgi:hypothetical protein